MRTLVHTVVMFAVLVLVLLVVIDLLVLTWSWWPVSEGAMRFDSASAIFIILPYTVGETSVSGIQAMVAGAVLVGIAVMLFAIQRTGRLPGLGGGGTLFMAILTALAGGGMVAMGAFLASQGDLTSAAQVPNVLPTPVALMLVRFTLLAQWHSIMMGAIILSAIALAYYEGPSLVREVRDSLRVSRVPPLRTDNAIVMIPRMYLGILGFYAIYFAILALYTVEPEVPDFDEMPLWQQLHAFAEASVWEEVLSRIFMLGIPLLVYHAWTGQREGSRWRYVVGGGFSIDTAAFVLIFFQAVVFALAHVAGWDLWKVLPTTISGIAFGYLFLKKGLWASIMLHFTFDYLGMTAPVLGEWGVDAESAMNAVYAFLVIVGIVVMVHYVVIVLKEGPGELRQALTERPAPSTAGGDGKA
ncbi:MAG: CPBP family intramembrane metalloprotease [Thermoplasmata archaeon]|nr:MAG: CPBP family intramembrane metalloprotease [Thermoplasmata archaeon]